MKRSFSIALGTVLAAGLLAGTPAAGADDSPVISPSSNSSCASFSDQANTGEKWATASGTITSAGGNVAGASVYAVNTENGKMTCAMTNGSGAYSLDLVGSGSPLREAADFWLIVANPPLDSTLGSNSRVLRSSSVALNSSQTASLSLGTATNSVSVKIGADDTTGFACTYTDGNGPLPVQCAMSQAYASGGFVARLALAPTTEYYLDGFSYRGGTYYQGVFNGTIRTTTVGAVQLPLETGPLPACNDQSSDPAYMGGTVIRGGGIPAQAAVTAFVLYPDGPQIVLDTWSRPTGQFRTCTGNVRDGFTDDSLIVTYTSVMGGNAYVKQLAGETDDSKLNLTLNLSAPVQVGGQISAGGQPLVGAAWSIAQLDEDGVPGPPIFSQTRTSATGGWGVFGLPDDTYALLAYPSDDDSTRALALVPFRVNGGVVSSWAGSPVSPAFPFTAPPVTLGTANVTGIALKPDGRPQAFSLAAALFDCTDPSNPNTCNMRMGRTNSQGMFAFQLPDAASSVRVLVQPGWFDTDVIETTSDPVSKPLNGSAFVTVTMKRPNAAFRVLNALAQPIANSNGNLARYVGPPTSDDAWRYLSGGTQTDEAGLMYFNFDDSGVYRLEVNPPPTNFGPKVVTYLKVTVSADDTVTLERCANPLDGAEPCLGVGATTPFNPVSGAWTITRPNANITGTLRSAPGGAGELVAEGSIDIRVRVDGGWRWFGWADSGPSGQVALYLPPGPSDAEATYQVTFSKPWRSAATWAANIYYVTANSTGVCLRANASTPCTPAGVLSQTFNLVSPNLNGTVETMSGSLLSRGWAEVYTSDDFGGERWVTSADVTGGVMSLYLPADDTYSIVVNPQDASDGTRTRFTQYIASGQTYTRTFRLKGANVTGRISVSGGAGAPNAEIQVEKFIVDGDQERWSWVNAWARSNGLGDFSLALDAGTYRLRVQPAPGTTGAATTVSPGFTLTSADDTEIVNVTLSAPNVSGTVTLPGGAPAPYSWLEVRKWSTAQGQYDWTDSVPGSMASQGGQYSMSLPSGRWQIIANPPWGNTTASRQSVNVVVSGLSVCLDNGSGGCSGGALANINIQLTAPNVSGSLTFAGGAPARNTWIDVRKYDSGLGRYEWDSSVQGINVDFNGSFAANLAIGDYRLIANPPWGNATATRSTKDITVSASYVCLTISKPCNSGNNIAPGALTIVLGSPNLQGTVSADGTPVAYSNLQIEKWDSSVGQWRWQEMWANTSQSGTYSLNLTDDGSYRITAQPTALTSDFSSGQAYAYVNGGQLCAPATDDSAGSNSPCTLAAAPLTLNIALAPADLVGKVTNGTEPLRDAWVSLLERNSSGWYEWIGGTSSMAGGKFALSLDDAGSSQRYRIEVFPPWGGSSDLTRKSVDIVAYKSDASTKVCLAADWNVAASTCAAAVGELTVALTGGNVRGFVKVPSPDDTGVRDAGVSVEKWVEAPWNPGSGQYVWTWADMFTNTRAGGAFSLSIEAPGTYRLEARPPWNNSGGLSSGKKIITVNGSGAWCTQDDTTGTSANAFGACEGALSIDSSRLEMRLSSPNVTTRLYSQQVGGVPVADAWVGVTRDVVQTVPGSDDTYISRTWLGGSSTNGSGFVYLNLETTGSYTLEFNPPWQSGSALPRFSKSVTITCTGGVCTQPAPGLASSVWFPTPNVNGFVLSADDASVKVPNAWISVEKRIGAGEYRWTDQGTSSNGKGKYVLSLDNGDYRVTAWPAWDSPSGVPRAATISVIGGVATCTAGCASGGTFDIRLRTANVTGSLVFGSPSQAMPFGWVEARQGGTFVAGAGANAQGSFSMNLDNGTYTFTAYPNWGVAAKPPVTTTVVVAGGVVTSVGGVARSTVLVDFDAVVPSLILNVGGTVTGNRFVTVSQWTGSTWSELPASTAVAASGVARFSLSAGTYRFTVVPGIGSSATNNTVDVTIDGDPATTQTAEVNPTEVVLP